MKELSKSKKLSLESSLTNQNKIWKQTLNMKLNIEHETWNKIWNKI